MRPATTEDVAIAVNFARRNGMKVCNYIWVCFHYVVMLSSVSGAEATATPAPTSGTAACTLTSGGGYFVHFGHSR